MKNYTYKCVPVPSVINTGNDAHNKAVESYESIINTSAAGGWELIHIDTVTSLQQPGCFSLFFGGKTEKKTFKMLVFKKEA